MHRAPPVPIQQRVRHTQESHDQNFALASRKKPLKRFKSLHVGSMAASLSLYLSLPPSLPPSLSLSLSLSLSPSLSPVVSPYRERLADAEGMHRTPPMPVQQRCPQHLTDNRLRALLTNTRLRAIFQATSECSLGEREDEVRGEEIEDSAHPAAMSPTPDHPTSCVRQQVHEVSLPADVD